MEDSALAELLVKEGLLTQAQMKEVVEESELSGQTLERLVLAKGWVREEALNHLLASGVDVKGVDLDTCLIEPAILAAIPQELVHQYTLIPVYKTDNALGVAMSNPANVFLIDELHRRTNLVIEPLFASEAQIVRAITHYYGAASSIRDIALSIDERTLMQADEKLGEGAPIIKLVNLLITQAVQERASDIHIEPEAGVLGLRYRIDGLLHRLTSLPKALQPAIVSRIKIMSGMDISEKRIPQDGRITMRVGERAYDLRVSTNPVLYGENVVLRLLDKSGMLLSLEDLGFDPAGLTQIKEVVLPHSYGIILATGPTGSGKSTTLYAMLQRLNSEAIHIVTVEDPVEYELPLVRQTQVNPKAGLHFSTALRALLRQDPNVIMVGEIRDSETAQLAVQAGLTGHLVLSSFHTNDAPTAFTRLIDMGVEPFLVASCMLGVIAQRLLRKVCAQCQETYTPTAALLRNLQLWGAAPPDVTFVRGKGCALCGHTGYKGRVGIFEFLKNSPRIQETVLKRSTSEEIRIAAVEEGMLTLRQLALTKLLEGVTTAEEVLRVTPADSAEWSDPSG